MISRKIYILFPSQNILMESLNLEKRSLPEDITLDIIISSGGTAIDTKIIIGSAVYFNVNSVKKMKKGKLVAKYDLNENSLSVSKTFTNKFLRTLDNYMRRNLKLDESQKDLLYFLYLCTKDERCLPYMELVLNGGM